MMMNLKEETVEELDEMLIDQKLKTLCAEYEVDVQTVKDAMGIVMDFQFGGSGSSGDSQEN